MESYSFEPTCDFQQCDILISVDSDEPVQPPFKLRNSKLCSVSSLTLKEYLSDKQMLWSDSAYAQADLRLCWSHIPHCWKSHVAAHFSFLYKTIYKANDKCADQTAWMRMLASTFLLETTQSCFLTTRTNADKSMSYSTVFSGLLSFFHFILLFWNHILICRSVRQSVWDISIRRRRVKYLLKWNSFSSSNVWWRE